MAQPCACGCGRIANKTWVKGHHPKSPRAAHPAIQFAERTDRSGPNGCWEWTGYCFGNGYAAIQVDRKQVLAHRISYELARGPIPPGMNVRHACDNRRCVNPDHLLIGTQQENVNDMWERDRQRIVNGVGNGKARLTEASVVNIRSAHANGEPITSLAERYGVRHGTIHAVVTRRSWKHVA